MENKASRSHSVNSNTHADVVHPSIDLIETIARIVYRITNRFDLAHTGRQKCVFSFPAHSLDETNDRHFGKYGQKLEGNVSVRIIRNSKIDNPKLK